MPGDADLLTPSEAAVIASVTVRDINRIIDERILPEHFYAVGNGRRLRVTACPFVQFYFHAAKALTAEERGVLIVRLSKQIGPTIARYPISLWRRSSRPEDWTVKDGYLTVSLWEFATSTQDRHAELAEARELVVEDSDILDGTPVIRGTRIPVYDIAASVAADISHERIRAAYPSLNDRMIELAAIYAEATPPRGRPRRPAMIPPDVRTISERKVARRRPA